MASRLVAFAYGPLRSETAQIHPLNAMSVDIEQHQIEIQRNLEDWQKKPLLQKIYAEFYNSIVKEIDPTIPGAVLELGSGIGNLKTHYPQAITSDLFPNPWLDLVCDAYE